MAKQKVLVICLNEFGSELVSSLWEGGAETVAIDADAAAVDEVKSMCDASFVGDATDAAVLKGVASEVDAAVVAFGDEFEAAVLVVAQLRRLGVPEIVARARSAMHADVLRAVGATRIVRMELEIARHVAADLMTPVAADVLERVRSLHIHPWPARGEVVGARVDAADVHRRFGIAVVGMHPHADDGTKGKRTFEPLAAGSVVAEGDILLLVGEAAAIRRFVEAMQG